MVATVRDPAGVPAVPPFRAVAVVTLASNSAPAERAVPEAFLAYR